MRVRVEVDGLGPFRRTMLALPEDIEAAAIDAVDETSQEIEATAQRLAPVRTRNLAGDITRRMRRRGLIADIGVWARDAFYSIFAEFGTEKARETPFLGPAFEAHARKLRRRVGQNIRARVRGRR